MTGQISRRLSSTSYAWRSASLAFVGGICTSKILFLGLTRPKAKTLFRGFGPIQLNCVYYVELTKLSTSLCHGRLSQHLLSSCILWTFLDDNC